MDADKLYRESMIDEKTVTIIKSYNFKIKEGCKSIVFKNDAGIELRLSYNEKLGVYVGSVSDIKGLENVIIENEKPSVIKLKKSDGRYILSFSSDRRSVVNNLRKLAAYYA